jgi:hypothetical protein
MQAYILYGYLDKVVLLEIVVPYVLNHCTQHTASRFTLHYRVSTFDLSMPQNIQNYNSPQNMV